jgi:large subunit ribosomal protein L22
VSPPERQRPDEGWDSLKVDELKDELEARGLPKSGTKAELVARLEESEGEGGAAPAAADDAPEAAAAADEAPEAESAPDAPEEGVAEEVIPPEEPAEEPTADEVEEAEGPEAAEAEADEDEPEAEADEAEDPSAEADEDEPEEDEGPEAAADEDEDAEGETAAAPATRRRGSAETSTGTRRAAPRRPDGDVVVRARSKYVRSAPRKARLVMDHIRGKEVEQARAILVHAPRAVAEDILKLLNSAVANAESNYELGPDELRVRKAFVDEGPTIKRFRPRALGRATRIQKRTSHMTIELTTTGNGR